MDPSCASNSGQESARAFPGNLIENLILTRLSELSLTSQNSVASFFQVQNRAALGTGNSGRFTHPVIYSLIYLSDLAL